MEYRKALHGLLEDRASKFGLRAEESHLYGGLTIVLRITGDTDSMILLATKLDMDGAAGSYQIEVDTIEELGAFRAPRRRVRLRGDP